jgi:hypothetical protein
MMWMDNGVTLLLTLRIALFRPTVPQLLDPNDDAWLPEGRDEQRECLFIGGGEVNEHSPESPHQEQWSFAITYSCNA